MHAHTHTDRQTHSHKHTDTHMHVHTHTHRQTHSHKHTDTHTDTHTHTPINQLHQSIKGMLVQSTNKSSYRLNTLVSSWQWRWWGWSIVRYGPRDWGTGKQWWQTWSSTMGWGENIFAKILVIDAEQLGSPLSRSWIKKLLSTSLSPYNNKYT